MYLGLQCILTLGYGYSRMIWNSWAVCIVFTNWCLLSESSPMDYAINYMKVRGVKIRWGTQLSIFWFKFVLLKGKNYAPPILLYFTIEANEVVPLDGYGTWPMSTSSACNLDFYYFVAFPRKIFFISIVAWHTQHYIITSSCVIS